MSETAAAGTFAAGAAFSLTATSKPLDEIAESTAATAEGIKEMTQTLQDNLGYAP